MFPIPNDPSNSCDEKDSVSEKSDNEKKEHSDMTEEHQEQKTKNHKTALDFHLIGYFLSRTKKEQDDENNSGTNKEEISAGNPKDTDEVSDEAEISEQKIKPDPDSAVGSDSDSPESASEETAVVPHLFETVDVPDSELQCPAGIETIRHEIEGRFSAVVQWLSEIISENRKLPPVWPKSQSEDTRVPSVLEEDLEKDQNIWFLGDVHGDLLAFETAIEYINSYSAAQKYEPPVIILLGDLADRFPYGYEVVFRLLDRMEKGQRFLWLAGNHDLIDYNKNTGTFQSGVVPSDLCDWLNSNEAPSENREEAKTFFAALSGLISDLPVALWFPDGTFAAHGAFPHKDRSILIHSRNDLSKDEMTEDFIWKRLHPTKRSTAVNRNSKSSQVGMEEFDQFCRIMKANCEMPIHVFLRGHDHYPERIKHYDKYKTALVLTINTLSCTLDGSDPLGLFGYETSPIVLQYRPGTPCNDRQNKCTAPEYIAHRLNIEGKTILQWYPVLSEEPQNENHNSRQDSTDLSSVSSEEYVKEKESVSAKSEDDAYSPESEL